MKKRSSKKGAIELSIGTIVIIVLAMAMLILGLVLIKNIFTGSTEAVTNINSGVIDQINKLFTDNNVRLVVYPSTASITLKQGQAGAGFAFSIRNDDVQDHRFTYTIGVDPNFEIQKKCNMGFAEANNWLTIDSGSITIPASRTMNPPQLISFTIPQGAHLCSVPFNMDVKEDGNPYDSRSVLVTVSQ